MDFYMEKLDQPVDISSKYGVMARQPLNPNILLDNKFSFEIKKLPETSYRITSFTVPAQTCDVAWQKTNMNPLPMPGQNITFDPFSIEFLVDEDLKNYKEISSWMRMNASPIRDTTNQDISVGELQYVSSNLGYGYWSDAVGTILNNEGLPNIEITFRDIFPIYLGDFRLATTTTNPAAVAVTARFQYAWFEIEQAH